VKVTDQDCVDYARECVHLAGMAENTPELREWLMQTARHWMAARAGSAGCHVDRTVGDPGGRSNCVPKDTVPFEVPHCLRSR
jgi:hypothetical protein